MRDGVFAQFGGPLQRRPPDGLNRLELTGLLDGRGDGRRAGRLGQRVGQSGEVPGIGAGDRRPGILGGPRQGVGRGGGVGRQSGDGRPATGDGAENPIGEALQPLATSIGRGQDDGVGQPVLGDKPAQMGKALLRVGHGKPVDLVEHDDGDVVVAGEPAEVLLVDEGVGVFLRVENPHHQVDPFHEVIDVGAVGSRGGVVIGKVDEDQVGQHVGAVGDDMPAGHSQPFEQGDRLRRLPPDRGERF